MQLIVHFGTFKTGTTSIQELFFRNQAAFLQQGVLYPKIPTHTAHHPLFALFHDPVPERIERRLGLDSASMVDRARRAWDGIKHAIARTKPEKVVLSSELFLYDPTLEGFRRFRTLLDEVGAKVTPCCYVRAPAPYYLSRVQENAKVSGEVTPPQPLAIRSGVEAVEEAFGERMLLRAYDPAAFADGDVVKDFISEVVGCSVPDGVARGRRFNETLSGEAMSISVANRRTNHAGKDHQQIPEHRRLLSLVGDLERQWPGGGKPRLKPAVADAVTRASVDLLWLREARHIVYQDIDYGTIDGRMPREIAGLREIDRICEVDAARRDMLLMRLLKVGIETQIEMARLQRIFPVHRVLAAKQRLKQAASRLRRRSGR